MPRRLKQSKKARAARAAYRRRKKGGGRKKRGGSFMGGMGSQFAAMRRMMAHPGIMKGLKGAFGPAMMGR